MSNQLVEEWKENKRAQKSLIELEQLSEKIDVASYRDLLNWGFEVHPFHATVCRLIFADDLKLSLASKNLVRIYFDILLLAFMKVSGDLHILMMTACLTLTAKLNESDVNSARMTLPILLAQINVQLSSEEMINLQLSVLEALQDRLRFTAPDAYLEIFMKKFPHKAQLFQEALPRFMELAMMHPKACSYSAEDLFHGAVLNVIRTSGLKMNKQRKIDLDSAVTCWDGAMAVSEFIRELYIEGSSDSQCN